MKIEFIIEGNGYKKLLEGKIPKSINNIKIKKNGSKLKGKNNHLFTLEALGSPIASAKELSQLTQEIKNIFDLNNVKYYILIDEASSTFALRLYPLACEFETKLRKFIYLALFDIEDSAREYTINKIKTTNKELSKLKDIPQNNFLEELTLGDLFTFLFDNGEFINEAKNKTSSITNTIGRTASKKEIIMLIEEIEEKTVWNTLFSESFPDCKLPKLYTKIFPIRNSVMHFKFISYQEYKKGLSIFNAINLDLDNQLKKGIVLENSTKNIQAVSQNYQYISSTLKSLSLALNTISHINLSALSELSETLSPIVNYYKTLRFDALDNITGALRNISPETIKLWNSLNYTLPLHKYVKDDINLEKDNNEGENNSNNNDSEDNQKE